MKHTTVRVTTTTKKQIGKLKERLKKNTWFENSVFISDNSVIAWAIKKALEKGEEKGAGR